MTRATQSGGEVVATMTPRATQLADAAREFRDNHHWVSLRLKGKTPCDTKWQKHTLADAIPKFIDTDNIGILLGKPSGDLVRLDADFPAIPDVIAILFPEPTLTFGRASSPRSGRLVTCITKTKNFVLPKEMKDHPGLPLHDGKPGLVVFQIMSTGSQAMMPPSIHPGSNEGLVWQSPPDTTPMTIDEPELLRRVGIEAFLMAVRQFWPARGTRNEVAMALARVLLEALSAHHPDDTERCAIVDGLVMATAMAGGDGEKSRTGKERAAATLEKMTAGEETTGMTRLVELLELPADVAKTFWKWLGGAGAVAVRDMRFPDVAARNGAPLRTLPNTKVALGLLGVECRHDLFSLRYEVSGHVIEEYTGELHDPAIYELRSLVYEHFGFDPSNPTVLDAVRTLANRHRYHPVRDYLDGLKWDRVPRLNLWLTTYLGAEDTPLNQAVGAITLIACVKRVREPGCKFDEMLVLEGEQGMGKSMALAELAVRPEWFTDESVLGLTGKEAIEITSGKWIIEIAELAGMAKRDQEKIKARLSSRADRGRLAYGYAATEAPRQYVPIGTTNADQYLRDYTGNRRYWNVGVGSIDLAALRRDRDQLWAEAADRETSGASIRLPQELWEAAEEVQRSRTIENPLLAPLANLLGDLEGKVTTEQLWWGLGIPIGRQSSMYSDLGNAMRALGWERPPRGFRVAGKPVRGYVKGKEPRRNIMCFPPDRQLPGSARHDDPEGEAEERRQRAEKGLPDF